MIGIIYQFTIECESILVDGYKPFYIGQHLERNSKEHFLYSKKKNYYGGGVIWNRLLTSLKQEYPHKWKTFIKREILCVVKDYNQTVLNKMEEFWIKKKRALYSEKIGGCNILPGAAIENNPALDPLVRKKMSKALRGREITKEHRLKLAIAFGGDTYRGDKNPNWGHKWTEEMKLDMSKKMSGRYLGEYNPNYGNRWNDEQKENLSKKMKERFKTEDNPMTGMKRITNGRVNTIIPIGAELPDGYWYGMKKQKKRSKNSTLSKIFITNGIDNKVLDKNAIIPNGWRRGMTKRKNHES